jgi:D-alanine-D-alanine ligase
MMGGTSAEREVSLRSGAAVAKGLAAAGYRVVEVVLDSEEIVLPPGVDVVFPALHGAFGEDGGIQAWLREAGVPYAGVGPEASRRAFDKVATKRCLEEAGVPTPAWEVATTAADRTLPLPVVVKPSLQGSSIGLRRVFVEADWAGAFAEASRYDGEVLVEAFIHGRELTVGIVNGQVLPVLEIRAPDGCYDYAAKYTAGMTEYLVPAPIPPDTEKHCRTWAARTADALACNALARIDFMLDAQGRLHVLELNTIPGFTETSLLPKAAAAAGIDFPALCGRILESASIH